MDQAALCVGEATVEIVGAVHRYPATGDQQELSTFTMQAGGAAANSAATLATLGMRTFFGGVLPFDFLGDFAAQSLSELGVDLTYLSRQEHGVPPVAFTIQEEGRRRTTKFFTRGDVQPLGPGGVPVVALNDVALLLVDGVWPELQLELVKAARARRVKTVLSAHAMAEGMSALASSCDTVIASEGFARELGPGAPKSLRELLALGAKAAVVTLGEDGCVGQELGGEPIRVEAQPVRVLDAIGAGDVFRGAYAYAWVRGDAFHTRLRFASAAASLSCAEWGPRAGIPELAAVERLITSS